MLEMLGYNVQYSAPQVPAFHVQHSNNSVIVVIGKFPETLYLELALPSSGHPIRIQVCDYMYVSQFMSLNLTDATSIPVHVTNSTCTIHPSSLSLMDWSLGMRLDSAWSGSHGSAMHGFCAVTSRKAGMYLHLLSSPSPFCSGTMTSSVPLRTRCLYRRAR